jgi:uncharacterized membrane protein YjjP (DUF1212 family)
MHVSQSAGGLKLKCKINIDQAVTNVEALSDVPCLYGDWLVGICYPFCGAGLAMLNQLGWWDILFSALYSILMFAMVWLAGRYGTKRMQVCLPISTGFVAGGLAAVTKLGIPELNLAMVALDAILDSRLRWLPVHCGSFLASSYFFPIHNGV